MKHYDLPDLSHCLFSTLLKIFEEVYLLFISARQQLLKRTFVLKCASSCAHARDLSVVAISANYVLLGPSPTYYAPLKTRVT